MKNLMQKMQLLEDFQSLQKNRFFAEHYNGKINYPLINKFLNQYGDSKFLVFGFTADVYNFFIKKLNFKRLKKILLMHLFFMVVDGRKWKKKN